jgi:hypothetical protein
MAFRGIQAETVEQGSVHKSIARELQHLVADPFEEWAKGYHVRHSTYTTPSRRSIHSLPQERLQGSRATVIDGYVKKYELAQAEVRNFVLLGRPLVKLSYRL